MAASAPVQAPMLVVKKPGRRFFAFALGGLGAVVVLAVAAVGLALAMSARQQVNHLDAALQQSNGRLQVANSRLQAMKVSLDATNAKLVATKNIDVSGLTKQLNQTAATVKHLTYCVPEVIQYANGLSFHGYSAATAGYLGGGYIENSFNLSRFCSDILTRPSSAGAEG